MQKINELSIIFHYPTHQITVDERDNDRNYELKFIFPLATNHNSLFNFALRLIHCLKSTTLVTHLLLNY